MPVLVLDMSMTSVQIMLLVFMIVQQKFIELLIVLVVMEVLLLLMIEQEVHHLLFLLLVMMLMFLLVLICCSFLAFLIVSLCVLRTTKTLQQFLCKLYDRRRRGCKTEIREIFWQSKLSSFSNYL